MAGRSLAVHVALRTEGIRLGFYGPALALLLGCGMGPVDRGGPHLRLLRRDSTGTMVGERDPSFHPLELTDPRGILSVPSGPIAVGESDLHQVILLDSTGTLIRRIGRQGAGPGEFDVVSLLAFWGESLAVHDPALHRLSIMGAAGALIRQRTIDPKGLIFPMVTGFRDDRAPILLGVQVGSSGEAGSGQPTRGIAVALRNDDRRDTLAILDGGPILSRGPIFFASRPAAASTDTGLWVGFGGAPELRFVPFDGSPTQVYRWTARTRPVSEVDKERVRAYATDRNANPELTGDDRFADSIPYFKTILSDPAGGVWLVGYSALGTTPDSAWRIDERAGTITALALPRAFRPVEVRLDRLLGIDIGPDGQQTLGRYLLVRGP